MHTRHSFIVAFATLTACNFHPVRLPTNAGAQGPTTLVVTAVYPQHADWNDYVGVSDRTVGPLYQDDVACEPTTDSDPTSCLHGGELRQAFFETTLGCAELMASDDLRAFAWSCEQLEGGVVRLYSTSATGGLARLIDGDGFLENRLRVALRSGDLVGESEPAIWDWANPVVPLPPEGERAVVLTDEGTIYVVDRARQTAGINIDADRVALVGLPGAPLRAPPGDSTLDSCDPSTGEVATDALVGQRIAVCSGDQSFIWIEGNIVGTQINRRIGVALVGTRFARLQNLEVHDVFDAGVYLRGAKATRIVDLNIARVGSGHPFASNESGLLIDGLSIGVVATGVTVADSLEAGIQVKNSTDVRLSNLMVANNGVAGLEITGGADNSAAGVVAVGNFIGIMVVNSDGWTLLQATVVNQGDDGIRIDSSNAATLARIATINNGDDGIDLRGTYDTVLHDALAVGHTLQAGIYCETCTNNALTGELWVGGNQRDCGISSSSSPGMILDTCTDSGQEGSNSYGVQPSSAVLHPDTVCDDCIVGPISSDDVVNRDDVDGSALYTDISDWTHFSHPYRAWALPGLFPSPDVRGPCKEASCRIWDFRVPSLDVAMRAAVRDPARDCSTPAEATLADALNVPNTFHPRAREHIGDGWGDDDGLCEADERCILAVNLGAYQGQGYLLPCAPALVGNTILERFVTNGAPPAGAP